MTQARSGLHKTPKTPVPVIATVRQQKVLLNMATLLPTEMELLIAQLNELLLPASINATEEP